MLYYNHKGQEKGNKTMKQVNSYNKRKAVWAMKWFLNELSKENANGRKIKLHEGCGFAALIHHNRSLDENEWKFIYNIDCLIKSGNNYKDGAGYVSANMALRAPYMRGFSQVTRILLHEFGHHMTYDEVMRLYGGECEMSKFYGAVEGIQARYIRVPAEWVATQWGIMWLADSEHRKLAKKFEKRFWACFE